MKSTPLLLALALAAPVSTTLAADNAAPATGQAAVPANADEWVRYLSDFTRNADMLVDPKKFVAALSQVSEPGFLVAALTAMMDPKLYNQSLASAMDPRAYANYARLMDPTVATTWMMTLLDPQFMNAVTYILTDPGKLMRWMMLPMDPKVTSAILNAMNPNIYAQWGTAGFDPKLWNTMMAPMNPNWLTGWAGTMAIPQTYGPTWGGWMATPYGAVPAPVLMPGIVPVK